MVLLTMVSRGELPTVVMVGLTFSGEASRVFSGV